jgi:hypothetical protein
LALVDPWLANGGAGSGGCAHTAPAASSMQTQTIGLMIESIRRGDGAAA